MLSFLLALLLLAQETSGSISGAVIDDSGASLPAVAVTIRNKITGRTLDIQTAYDGTYTAPFLDPGNYTVEIKLSGFTSVMYPDVQVLTGKTVRIDATLKPGAVDALVVPPESISQLDLQSFAVADNMNVTAINVAPKGRSFLSLAALAPSVISGDVEGGLQINGASAAENDYIIDAISTTSVVDGRPRQMATFDYIQQLQVKTAGFAAEFRGALGGVVTAVTRSGGDEYHGDGYYYFGGDALNATPVQRLALDPRDNRTTGYFQDRKDKDKIHEPGFSIGGPIRSGQLYFYTSIGARLRRQIRTYGFNFGADEGTIERTERAMNAFTKISFVRSSILQGHVAWLYTPSRAKGTLPAFNGSGPNWISSSRAANLSNANRGFFSPQSSYSASVGHTPLPNLVISSRGGFFWDNYRDTGVPNVSSVTFQTASAQGPAGTQNFPASQRKNLDLGKRLNAHADATYFAQAFGAHELKAGYAAEWLGNNVDIAHPGGGYVLVHWDRSFTSPVTGATGRGQFGYYEINQLSTIGSTMAWTQAIYGQDQWQITPRLTLNLGLRVDQETMRAFKRDLPQNVPYRLRFPFSEKIAPRLAATFDMLGDGRAKLYGSWGRFFDPLKFSLVRGAFGGDRWTVRYRSLETQDVFSLGGGNLPGRDLWNPSVTDSFRERLIPRFGSDTVAPRLRSTTQDTFSAGLEYEWRRNHIFGVRYSHHQLRRAIEDLSAVVGGQEVYLFAANPGEGVARNVQNTTGLTAPFPFPKPARRYDAVQFTFLKRPSIGWFGDLSYTWSRLYGNYAGLAASGASYATNSWDLDEVMFDAQGNIDPQGPLPTDRTHVFKFKGGYEFGFGTEFGAFVFAGSGTPLTTKAITTNFLTVLVNGPGDIGRTKSLAYADFAVAHNFKLDDIRSVRVEFNVQNAFNTKTSRHRFEYLNRSAGAPRASSAMDLSRVDLRRGYNFRALIAASPDGQNAFDPRYNLDDLFNPSLAARLGLRFFF